MKFPAKKEVASGLAGLFMVTSGVMGGIALAAPHDGHGERRFQDRRGPRVDHRNLSPQQNNDYHGNEGRRLRNGGEIVFFSAPPQYHRPFCEHDGVEVALLLVADLIREENRREEFRRACLNEWRHAPSEEKFVNVVTYGDYDYAAFLSPNGERRFYPADALFERARTKAWDINNVDTPGSGKDFSDHFALDQYKRGYEELTGEPCSVGAVRSLPGALGIRIPVGAVIIIGP